MLNGDRVQGLSDEQCLRAIGLSDRLIDALLDPAFAPVRETQTLFWGCRHASHSMAHAVGYQQPTTSSCPARAPEQTAEEEAKGWHAGTGRGALHTITICPAPHVRNQ
jgi:hypothetical protein